MGATPGEPPGKTTQLLPEIAVVAVAVAADVSPFSDDSCGSLSEQQMLGQGQELVQQYQQVKATPPAGARDHALVNVARRLGSLQLLNPSAC